MKLNPGDIVLACTDGLLNAKNVRGEKFGKERIQRYMIANAMYPAHRMAQFEYDELVKFMSHEMQDEVSVLVMKYLKSNASEIARTGTKVLLPTSVAGTSNVTCFEFTHIMLLSISSLTILLPFVALIT